MEIEMENMENQSHTEDPKPLHIFKRARTPVTLTFEDVKHRISKKRKGFFFNSKKSDQERLILSGASGAVLPGEMLVILGPSGSGKTTLLTALGGRLGGKTSGRIIYNGKPFSAAIKRNMGFVAQINYFYPHLTVHETLVFAALLRLPGELAKEEKILQVEAVINQLGLNQCKNTIVGGKFVRGISGGERKRLGIGEEMLRNPSLLFLDEPTSGLDSTIASRIVSFLWRLAKGGRTIIMTIHQPSSRLFYMFDKILLLSEGRTVYFGKGEHVLDYFASIGYALSVAMNPSDFLLDLANGVFSGDSKDIKSVKQALISAYESKLVDKLKVELQGIDNVSHTSSEDEEIGLWSTSWQQQFFVLLKRSLKERRHQSYSRLKIGQVLAISFLTGLLWWQSTDLPNQVGLLFFYIKFGGFFSVTQNVLTFPRERLVLTKERSSGMYRLSSYFMARTVGDLPMDLALPTLFVVVTYWMGGLKHNATNFFHTLIVLLYTVLLAQSLGLAIGAVVMKQKMAMTVAAVVILSLQLTCGFLVQNVPAFIDWIKYLSLTYYSYKLLLRSQYKPDQRYQCGSNGSCLVKDFPRIKSVGLDEQFLSVVALAFMLVGFRLVAYVALMKVGVIHHRKY